MRIYLTRLLAVCAALLFTGFSLYYLLLYTRSMDGQFHDLSMFGSEREMMEEWNGDTKGWTVFVQEGEMYHELDALGWGSYSGLDYPGQTVYFSRTMTEDVDSPTLRLYAANRAIAVFLGDKTLYTDSPEQDNKVGSLALSEFSSDREALTIALPPDYLGKTLTIAQSSPEFPDSPSSEVTICGVELYCSYTSQSDLISESFRTAVPATLVFTLGVLALAALLWQGFHGKWDMGLAMLAVMAFSLVLGLLSQASFSYFYFKTTTVDWRALCRAISLSAMLVFLGQRGGGRRRWLLWTVAALHGGLALLGLGDVTSPFTTWSELTGCVGLLAATVLSLLWQSEKRRFYRLFTPLYLTLLSLTVAGAVVYGFLTPQWGQAMLLQLRLSIQNGIYRFFLWKWADLAFIGGAVAATIEVICQESERRTETQLLLQRGALAQENYENLRSQNEEISVLRHDLRHHITVLKSLCQEGDFERVSAYLDTMGAWNMVPADYTVHPAVNGILAVMMARSSRLGIQSEVRIQLPRCLPIPDSDLCALLMNLLENAIEANGKNQTGQKKWMKVTIHIRGDYLYVGVENARFEPVNFDAEEGLFLSTKERGFHGYGLKSARAIARKYGSELRLEVLDGQFSASTALLLPK